MPPLCPLPVSVPTHLPLLSLRQRTRQTDRCCPLPPPPIRHHASFRCRALLHLGSQLSMLPLPPQTPTTTTMSLPVLLDVFLLRDLNCAAGCHCRQPIIVATKLSSSLTPPILLSSLSCLLQPSFLAISGPPLLPPVLVCGRHPCHLSLLC
jgi:hypothetical protein